MVTWFRKASVAFLIAGASTLGMANADGIITSNEWIGVGVAALIAGVSVFAVPNSRKNALDSGQENAL